jgi:EAL domain-containing protein (putative c-di-GMP-specific phosphodiesterase class I)/DNA-binding response OmpR family regulator
MSVHDEVILLVDDDPLELEIIADDLANLGVRRVLTAQSGAEALDLIKRGEPITTLMTDICMPNMDGPQFLRQLADTGCAIRVVLVSGVSKDIMYSIGTLGRSHGLNVMGFIHKPVQPEALKALLIGPEGTVARSRQGTVNEPELDLSVPRLLLAIEKREIHPWYQPKVSSAQLRVVGVEALARWRFPDGGLVSPGRFIPAIEAAGLSDALFFGMLEQVLVDMQRWRAEGHIFKASVNLSMDCAFQLDLPDRLQELLKKYGVPAKQIVIEVTESRLMANKSAAMETLTRLSLMGFILSIDDFGTGYSSLAQVAALPFGELKLDTSFVQQAGLDIKADAILQSTVTLGRSLGMEVVAEGVETFEQLDILRNFGAPVVQGFLVARPMPANQFEGWLANWRPGLNHKPGCARQFTLLVVDDDRAMRAVIEAELADRMPGVRVLSAANGEEALTIAAKNVIDAATLDFHMPGIDGLELLRRLRNCCPAARYVLLTSDLSEQTAREATRLGALYCPKPLNSSSPQVDRIVRHFLEP